MAAGPGERGLAEQVPGVGLGLIKPLPYGNRFQSTDDERLACCELCLVRQTELERSFQDTA